MAVVNYPAGILDNIGYVLVYARYEGKWVYCWHKHRKHFEHPGGHVEEGESAMEAAKRELYEESGITDCKMIPLWDYAYEWENGEGQNNGRVYFAEVNSIGELPESEMSKIELFDSVPENYTYDREAEDKQLKLVKKIIEEYE